MYLNNISLLDHIIVGVNDTYSYYHSGLLAEYEKEAERILNIPKPKIAQPRAKYGDAEWRTLQKTIADLNVHIVVR